MEPDTAVAEQGWLKPLYPAGSRFSQDIRCDGPLPNEMPIAADTPHRTAEAAVLHALTELGAGDSEELNVMTVPYHGKQPKYHAFDRAMGTVLRRFSSDRCHDGEVVVNAVAVGSYPPPDPAQARTVRHSNLLLGTALSCLKQDPGKA